MERSWRICLTIEGHIWVKFKDGEELIKKNQVAYRENQRTCSTLKTQLLAVSLDCGLTKNLDMQVIFRVLFQLKVYHGPPR